MDVAEDFFNSTEYLEPKCSNCDSKIEYGISTKFDENLNSHVCLKCGSKV